MYGRNRAYISPAGSLGHTHLDFGTDPRITLIQWVIAGHQEMAVQGAVTFEVDTRKKYKIGKNLSIVLFTEK